jgi:hypothetical protein
MSEIIIPGRSGVQKLPDAHLKHTLYQDHDKNQVWSSREHPPDVPWSWSADDHRAVEDGSN